MIRFEWIANSIFDFFSRTRKSKLIFALCDQLHSMWSMERTQWTVWDFFSSKVNFEVIWCAVGWLGQHHFSFHQISLHWHALGISFTEIINGVCACACVRMMFDMQIVATNNKVHSFDSVAFFSIVSMLRMIIYWINNLMRSRELKDPTISSMIYWFEKRKKNETNGQMDMQIEGWTTCKREEDEKAIKWKVNVASFY